MKKTAIGILAILTMVMLSLTLIPTVFSQTSNIKIVSYSYYYSQGFLDVVGEVENTGSSTIAQVVLAGKVTSSAETTMDSSASVWVVNLLPGQKAPFYMTFIPQSADGQVGILPDVAKVELVVVRADATTNYQYPDLAVSNEHHRLGTNSEEKGTYFLTGTLKNTGTQTAQNLRVIGTFYDSANTVVAVGGYTSQKLTTSLAPSASVNFEFVAFDYNDTGMPASQKIASYSLLIQAEAPMLEGSGPQVTPYPTGHTGPSETASPTSTQTITPAPGNTSNSTTAGYTPPTLAYAAVVVIVLAVIVGAVLALKKRKPAKEETQPAKKTAAKKPKSKPN
jgi:hypothetical protein